MANKDQIQKKNIDEANDSLGTQLNLVASLQDKMSQLLKVYKEKGTLDKQSLDSVKSVVAATKSLKAEYDSVKEVQKDLAKNAKLQQDIERQKNALYKQGGESLKDDYNYAMDEEDFEDSADRDDYAYGLIEDFIERYIQRSTSIWWQSFQRL